MFLAYVGKLLCALVISTQRRWSVDDRSGKPTFRLHTTCVVSGFQYGRFTLVWAPFEGCLDIDGSHELEVTMPDFRSTLRLRHPGSARPFVPILELSSCFLKPT